MFPKIILKASATLLLFFIPITELSAHEGRPVFIEVKELKVEDKNTHSISYQLRWKIPPVLAPGFEPHIELKSNFCKQINSSKLSLDSATPLIGKKYYQCTTSDDLSIAINYPDSNPALSSLLLYEDHLGHVKQFFSSPEKYSIKLVRSSSPYAMARQYTVAGIKHILSGYDHIMLILCLIMIASSYRRIILTITGFTIAHSITLAMSVLNILTIPALLVEMLIALSIVVLAAEILKAEKPTQKTTLMWCHPVLLALAFGLLHGFGFASVLTELGLPPNMKLTALLFFNLGIELGQIALVLVAILFLNMVIKRLFDQDRLNQLRYLLVYTIGILASYWLVERFTQNLNI